jgi:hypothetical protein
MNNSLLKIALMMSQNSGSSYLKNFKLAQINLELNRQESNFSPVDKRIHATTSKRNWRKAN